MLENIKCTKIINPGQIPVDCSDQPVFALTKELQFRFPKIVQNYFSLFEGLHIEQSLLVLNGQLIKGSGLMKILNLQKLSTVRLSVVVDVNSIKRATYCVHVTLSTLCKKLNEATALDNLNNPCPHDWLHQILGENKMYLFWKMLFDFQVNYLMSIRPESKENFLNYLMSIRPCFQIFMKILMKDSLLFKNQKTNFLR